MLLGLLMLWLHTKQLSLHKRNNHKKGRADEWHSHKYLTA